MEVDVKEELVWWFGYVFISLQKHVAGKLGKLQREEVWLGPQKSLPTRPNLVSYLECPSYLVNGL